MDYKRQAQVWDQWIREGHSNHVRQLCRELNHKSVPRDILLEYAQLARRVAAPELIVAWFGPLVRSERPLDHPASDQEKALYALGLSRIGAFREAETILREIPATADPQVYFYQASLYISQWNYAKAIPKLKKYLSDPRVTPYAKLVGRLNLCAALVACERNEGADSEISRLMKRLAAADHHLLLGNLHEIRSQLRIKQGRFDEALADLGEAGHLLRNADELSRVYVDKWRAVINLKLTSGQSSALHSLMDVRRRAVEAQSWEVVRDCDLQTAIQTADEDLLARVYWGTLFAAYKNRIRLHFKDPRIPPREFIWSSAPQISSAPVDLVDAAPTPILKRLFFILTREFYRPLRTTEIFSFVYEDEFYNPKSGPEKMHKIIARARRWLDAAAYPIEIHAYRNAFRLHFTKPVQLLLHEKLRPMARSVPVPESLRQKSSFTSREWARENDVSARTARRQLLTLARAGRIKSVIRGPKTIYSLAA